VSGPRELVHAKQAFCISKETPPNAPSAARMPWSPVTAGQLARLPDCGAFEVSFASSTLSSAEICAQSARFAVPGRDGWS
jgi:hypothetical protein